MSYVSEALGILLHYLILSCIFFNLYGFFRFLYLICLYMFGLMDCVLDRILYGCGSSVILSVVIGGLVDIFFICCLVVGVVMNMIDL